MASQKKNDILPMILVDSREKNGFKFNKSKKCLGSRVECLSTGDYSLEGLTDYVTVERKASINELVACLGVQRKRFMAEIERMKDIKYKFLVVEGYWSSALKPTKYSKLSVNYVMACLFSIMLKHGVHVIFAGTHENARKLTKWALSRAYHYYLKEKGIQ